MSLFIKQTPTLSFCFLPLGPNMLPRTLFSDTVNLFVHEIGRASFTFTNTTIEIIVSMT